MCHITPPLCHMLPRCQAPLVGCLVREIFSVGPLQPTARITSVFLSANADILTCYSLIVREGEMGGGGPWSRAVIRSV